jgi:hypothetical protein
VKNANRCDDHRLAVLFEVLNVRLSEEDWVMHEQCGPNKGKRPAAADWKLPK